MDPYSLNLPSARVARAPRLLVSNPRTRARTCTLSMAQPRNPAFLVVALLCGEIQAYNPGGSPWAVQASGAATAQSVNLIQDAHLRAAQNETKIPVDVLTPTDFKNSPHMWENFRYAAMGIVLIVILGLIMTMGFFVRGPRFRGFFCYPRFHVLV